MTGQFKTFICCVAAAALTGCSGSAGHEESAKPVYQGTVEQIQYDLGEGKTVMIDDQGKRHTIDGYPMLFHGKIKLSEGGHGGYEVEVLSLAQASAEAAPAAEVPAAPASEYE
jgi:hypothetical protein